MIILLDFLKYVLQVSPIYKYEKLNNFFFSFKASSETNSGGLTPKLLLSSTHLYSLLYCHCLQMRWPRLIEAVSYQGLRVHMNVRHGSQIHASVVYNQSYIGN